MYKRSLYRCTSARPRAPLRQMKHRTFYMHIAGHFGVAEFMWKGLPMGITPTMSWRRHQHQKQRLTRTQDEIPFIAPSIPKRARFLLHAVNFKIPELYNPAPITVIVQLCSNRYPRIALLIRPLFILKFHSIKYVRSQIDYFTLISSAIPGTVHEARFHTRTSFHCDTEK